MCDAAGRLLQQSDTTLTQMLPWPAMLAYRRALPRGQWVACHPEFAIPPEPVPEIEEEEILRVVNRFCAAIPPDVRRVVAAFPERHWDLLAWVARTGMPAQDLLASNPTLAFAFACDHRRLGGRGARVRRTETLYLLPCRKQTRILERLGFPATERARKILRKIQPRAVTLRRLTRLREWLTDAAIADALSRLPVIDLSVMALIERGVIRRTAFADLLRMTRADQDRAADTSIRMRVDALRIWQRTAADAEAHPNGRHSARPAQARMTGPRVGSSVGLLTDFPPPPVPGTDVIIPILSNAQLIEEGRIQKNCVAGMAKQILARRLAIYRVLYPERATASLRRKRNGWVLDQLEAANNKRALTATFRAVANWLTGHRTVAAKAVPVPCAAPQDVASSDAQLPLASLG